MSSNTAMEKEANFEKELDVNILFYWREVGSLQITWNMFNTENRKTQHKYFKFRCVNELTICQYRTWKILSLVISNPLATVLACTTKVYCVAFSRPLKKCKIVFPSRCVLHIAIHLHCRQTIYCKMKLHLGFLVWQSD